MSSSGFKLGAKVGLTPPQMVVVYGRNESAFALHRLVHLVGVVLAGGGAGAGGIAVHLASFFAVSVSLDRGGSALWFHSRSFVPSGPLAWTA